MSMIEIEVVGLQMDAALGIHSFELEDRQTILIDVKIKLSSTPQQDSIHETASYDDIADTVRRVIDARHYNLAETLCVTIAEALKTLEHVHEVTVAVTKSPRTVACKSVVARVTL
ncbi:dihydroneopterin aldolase [Maricaulis sp.]|uniref:dihydroneopterin aldolase n=1 Tax=Maricaulis sp. TaxID=1486257 RepID=UPI003A93FF16